MQIHIFDRRNPLVTLKDLQAIRIEDPTQYKCITHYPSSSGLYGCHRYIWISRA